MSYFHSMVLGPIFWQELAQDANYSHLLMVVVVVEETSYTDS